MAFGRDEKQKEKRHAAAMNKKAKKMNAMQNNLIIQDGLKRNFNGGKKAKNEILI